MITVKQLYIKDVANAPYLDRFFYYALNYLSTNIFERDYMTVNPLRWCLLTFIMLLFAAVFYLVFIPVVAIPCIALDAYKMPEKYNSDEYGGYYVDYARLIRALPQKK